MFRTLIVGTDGSKGAFAALRRCGELARALDVPSVHVVTACHPLSSAEVRRIEESLPAEFHDLVSPHMQANDRFNEAVEILQQFGVDAINHEQSGDAAEAIIDVAQAVGADLIVVGARGLGAVTRFFRGSVSTKVAHHSPCDVLIVEHVD